MCFDVNGIVRFQIIVVVTTYVLGSFDSLLIFNLHLIKHIFFFHIAGPRVPNFIKYQMFNSRFFIS